LGTDTISNIDLHNDSHMGSFRVNASEMKPFRSMSHRKENQQEPIEPQESEAFRKRAATVNIKFTKKPSMEKVRISQDSSIRSKVLEEIPEREGHEIGIHLVDEDGLPDL
jgi:hypothetical protein